MNDINIAIKIIKEGGIVVFPTDTAFGIGCRMDDSGAVRRLFEIRKRPIIQATPVLVGSLSMAQEYMLSTFPADVISLAEKYWPGGLTIIYPCLKEKVLDLIRGGKGTLGVRMPDHGIPLSLIDGIGVPILGPSANFHGEQTPYKYQDLNPLLLEKVDCVLEGECKTALASTVVDCSINPWKILRQGAVHIEL